MRTNIDIDDALMDEAIRLSGATSKKEVVDVALRKFVQIKRQAGLRALRGIGWDGDLDDMRTSKHVPADD